MVPLKSFFVDKLEYSYFFIWGKRSCPYCQKAQQLFVERQLPHMVYFLDENLPLLQEVKKNFNWDTVPLIVEQKGDGTRQFLGGHDDFVKYLEELTVRD
jgi:glutaredoxin